MTFLPTTVSVTDATGALAVTPTLTPDGSVTFELGDITEKVTIVYETEIDPDFFRSNKSSETFTNRAWLSWDELTGEGIPTSAGVGIGSNLIGKSGAGYDRSSGIITWKIEVNRNQIELETPVITDHITTGQTYVANSAEIKEKGDSLPYAGGSFAFDDDENILSYNFANDINKTYEITFKTKVDSFNDTTKNHSGIDYQNIAKLNAGSIEEEDTGTQRVQSNVLRKNDKGYDLATKHITWEIIVNENGLNPSATDAIELENVTVTDTLPDGVVYVPNSIKFLDKNDALADITPAHDYDDDENILTITFNVPITKQYKITFETEITDYSKFTHKNNQLNNDYFEVENEVELKHKNITTSVEVTAKQRIDNHIVSKQAIATTFGNKYIEWVVYINSNAVNLNQFLDVDKFWFIDQLEEGLELDTDSVKLISYGEAINVPSSIPANGIDGLSGTPVLLDGSETKYDATTREFRFDFPENPLDTAYKLAFTTYVTESVQPNTSFSNSISLHGSKEGVSKDIHSAFLSGSQRQVNFLQAGSMGYGNLGQFIVHKVDLDNGSKVLPSATFALYDQYGNKIQEKSTVDGELEFNRIKFEQLYFIKEVKEPEGYLLSGDATADSSATISAATITSADDIEIDVYAVKLNNNATDKLAVLTFENQKIKANVRFLKTGDNGPLEGATFGLYPEGITPDTATEQPITETSNTDGIVLFEDVPHGTYDIYELTAPDGYVKLNGVVDKVVITPIEAVHGTTISSVPPVPNELIKANIEFKKTDGLNGLPGAEFTLYDIQDEDDPKPVGLPVVSKSDGTVEFKDVLAGTYTLSETDAPPGYIAFDGVIGSITVTEADHGETLTHLTKAAIPENVTNTLIQTTIEFTKVESRHNQELAGATFGLYNSLIAEVQRVTTGSDGIVTFNNVGEGEYTIKEILAPNGYELNVTEYQVSVTADDHNDIVPLDRANPTAPVVNTLIEADVTFKKVSDSKYMQDIELKGAEFVLEPINAADHLYPGEKYEATSDEDGIVLFESIPFGKYNLYEVNVLEGYNSLLNEVIGTVDINASNHDTTVMPVDGLMNPITTVTNQIIKGDITFKKVAANTDRGLRNARFALYAADDITFDNEIATATSDNDGIVLFEDVEYGEYTIIEVSPPSGYYKSKDTLSVVVSQEGETYNLGSFENRLIPNDIIEGAIEVKKVNTLGDPLAGAKFRLYDAIGSLVAEAVSNSSGIARFSPVYDGIYTVEEVEAPINYVKSDQVENVTIASHQNYVQLTFVNERSSDALWPSVSVQKVDDAGAALTGVKFALYKETDTTFTTPVANSTTDANGVATFKNIAPGKYVVKEIESLEGYILTTVTLPVTVTEDAETHNAGTIENRVIRGDIVITKVNELSEPLQGAEFGLYDMDGKLVTVARSNSDGIVSFKDIPYGSYRLKELTAPESYKKSDAVTLIDITVDGKVLAYTIVNEKGDDLPKDDSGKPGPTPGSNEPGNSGAGSNKPGLGTDTSGKPGSSTADGTNGDRGSASDMAKPSNELPKTGDSIIQMFWLFGGSGLLIVALLLIGRRKTQKQ